MPESATECTASDNIEDEKDRVLFIRSVCHLFASKARITLNPKKLYEAQGYAVKEMLKIAHQDEVLARGATLVLHSWGVATVQEGEVVKGVVFESKEGRKAILAQQGLQVQLAIKVQLDRQVGLDHKAPQEQQDPPVPLVLLDLKAIPAPQENGVHTLDTPRCIHSAQQPPQLTQVVDMFV